MNSRPAIFIGSSSEGLEIAKALQEYLEGVADVELWTQGVFDLSVNYLESLVKEITKVDFALLVLTADDVTRSRGQQKASPRNNVLFELGLFIGKLGLSRCFFVYNEQDQAILKLPSDLLGITAATYHLHSGGNLVASLGSLATRIGKRVITAGCRPAFMQLRVDHEPENNLNPNISGTWEGFSPGATDPHQRTSIMKIEQRGSFVWATVERITADGVRRFNYEGRFSAGQVVLFFEDTAGRGFIIGSMVLHLASNMRTLVGKSTYFHHDSHEVVATDRLYVRVDGELAAVGGSRKKRSNAARDS